ncbi:MAG: MlaD family protein [Verrucomicrobia bacterium]|nr:MlaD family protein [Verrucomicrobiota bacterium]MCF7707567.1 MlaD family protein [Verrucomicrobiota bacterium]
MPLQDLTPQLRTRLSRAEKVAGLFVGLAVVLLIAGFTYYLYHTAKRKGWFLTKAPYFTFVESASGLQTGDPVKLMGFDVGQITKIEAMPPSDPLYNVYVEFEIKYPYYGYLWTDSQVNFTAGDFLGNRYLEVTKGTNGAATYQMDGQKITGIYDEQAGEYKPITKDTKPYWLWSVETPAISDRVQQVIAQVEKALPSFLQMTNDIKTAVSNSVTLTSNLNHTVTAANPAITNLSAIALDLRERPGALGEWIIPTNINQRLDHTLASTDNAISSAGTNINTTLNNLNITLTNLASISSNLNNQVQANHLILTELSSLVVNANSFIQGLKRNWLIKSAFAESDTNKPVILLEPGKGKTQ